VGACRRGRLRIRLVQISFLPIGRFWKALDENKSAIRLNRNSPGGTAEIQTMSKLAVEAPVRMYAGEGALQRSGKSLDSYHAL
jgi:hypothetical protein